MATFTRTTRTQQCPHCLGDSSLATDHLTEVIRRNMEFQSKDTPIIANFANLHGSRIVYQRFGDVLDEFTHFLPLNEILLGLSSSRGFRLLESLH